MDDYLVFTDEELVSMAHKGDSLAEEILINRYKETVRGKANLYFIVGADKEDVVQEGMIGVFKAIKNYDDSRNATFRTFVELCINRQIITAVKSASRLKHKALNSYVSLSGGETDESSPLDNTTLPKGEYDPEELLLLKDFIDNIFVRVPQHLSKFEQAIWPLFLQGKSYVEIAEILGKTPKSIDNALQRIKKKLQRFLWE